MRKSLWIIPLLFAAMVAPNAHADTCSPGDTCTDYTITFTTASGLAPTGMGTFTYDTTTDQFTSFMVTWDGKTFDMTDNANSPSYFPGPTGCTGEASTGGYAFQMLNKALTGCGALVAYQWDAAYNPLIPGITFQFKATEFVTPVASSDGFTGTILGLYPSVSGNGGWTVTPVPATVPEPSTIGLTLVGLGGLMRKRIISAFRRATRRS
jgi:hypothetical protein